MKVLKQVFNFYINASIHVALAVYALAWITLLEFDIPYDETVLYLIFYATITAYNFIKYFGVAKFHHRRLTKSLKVIQVFSFICFILMCFYAYNLETTTLYYLIAFGIVTFLYAIPFIPKKVLYDSQQNLRGIGGIKIYIISLVWAGVTVILPIINSNTVIEHDVLITFFQRLFFTVVLILPFDIRDLKYDSVKLATIPQRIGIKQTKIVGIILLIVFCLLQFFKDTVDLSQIALYVVISIITVLFLINSKKEQSTYYSAFFVEGIPIIWLCLLLLNS